MGGKKTVGITMVHQMGSKQQDRQYKNRTVSNKTGFHIQ
jgi:hypothetical protein